MSEKLRAVPEPETTIGEQELSPLTIEARLLQVLADMEQPLHYRDIHLLAEGDGYGEIDTKRAKEICSDLFLSGKLVRLRRGVYSLPEFVDKDYDSPDWTMLEESIKNILEQAGRRFLLQDLKMALAAESGEDTPISKGKLKNKLDIMLRRGKIVRPERGVYALPQFENEPLKPSLVATTQDRLHAILEQAGQSVSKQELSLGLQADGHEELDPLSVNSSLRYMINTGKVIRTARGHYSLPEFTDKIYESPAMSVGERCLAVLWQSGRALHHSDIYLLVEADGYEHMKAQSIVGALSKLVKKNLAVRVDSGTYALPEFSCASDKRYEAYVNKVEITGRVVKALDLLGGSASIHRIYIALAVGNLEILSQEQVASLLKRMSEDDKDVRKIARVGKDTYCLPELAVEEHEEVGPELKPRLLAVLKEAAKPLHLLDIYGPLEGDGHGPVNHRSAAETLNVLFHAGNIVKVMESVYALPEFEGEQYELPRLSARFRVELSLRAAARPLHLMEMYRLVNIDDQDDIRLGTIGTTLSSMTVEEQVVRVAPGVYALPEFADREYELLKYDLRYRLVEIFNQLARPLYLREVVQQLEESDDGQGINYQHVVKNRLLKMADRGEIVRVSRGIYALPQFAGEEYDLPKPIIRERLMTVFSQAARPLHWQEAADQVELDGFGVINRNNVTATLSSMKDRGMVTWVSPGVYCLPEFMPD